MEPAKTFSIQTLGCRLNHYESEQVIQFLLDRGWVRTEPARAALRVVNTCSVTTHAAGQSRQSVRRVVRLPLAPTPNAANSAQPHPAPTNLPGCQSTDALSAGSRSGLHHLALQNQGVNGLNSHPSRGSTGCDPVRARVLVIGCWATSDRDAVRAMPGVDGVLTHHQDVASELDRLLETWRQTDRRQRSTDVAAEGPTDTSHGTPNAHEREAARAFGAELSPGPVLDDNNDGWIKQAWTPAGQLTCDIKSSDRAQVNGNFVEINRNALSRATRSTGTTALPLLGHRQSERQRAYLKIQDGCDAHCTYCIIPKLRPVLWSKPIDDAVTEAQAMVAAGHPEIVLTGIFLGAYGQPTALRRRQPGPTGRRLGELIDAICTRVPGLQRLRLSSLEPGDLTDDLLRTLTAHPQVVPHFHLPLQSGSDLILRRMNRQYTRGDFLDMVGRVRVAFDRPALTTDVVVGFPGEDDAEFEQTASLVAAARFIHVHAFPYSPRPGTAAARWTDQFVRGPVVSERIERLQALADQQSLAFRSSFVGQTADVIVERDAEPHDGTDQRDDAPRPPLRHGRCERYFPIWFEDARSRPGDAVPVRINHVTPARTFGERI